MESVVDFLVQLVIDSVIDSLVIESAHLANKTEDSKLRNITIDFHILK